jgi:hypothetical protein
MPAALVAGLAVVLAQGAAPLKKSDLIRLLSTTTLVPSEIADLVQRRCVSFTPSARDKADLRALGADDAVMRRLDECARKVAPLRAAARLREAVVTAGGRAAVTVELRRGEAAAAGVRVVLRGSGRLSGGPDAELLTDRRGRGVFEFRVGTQAGTHRLTVADPEGLPLAGTSPLDLTVRPAPLIPAPSRTGFVSGAGQRGRVGTRLPLPVVFEVRDSANRPVAGRPVALAGANATLQGAAAATDSMGQVRVFVVLGDRAGPAHVTATLGGLERQAPLVALPGPPARLVLRCEAALVARLTLGRGEESELTAMVQDLQGNALAVTDVRTRVDDERVARVVAAGVDRLTVRGERAGSTRLEVAASGLRAQLPVAVEATAASAAPCRRSAPRG